MANPVDLGSRPAYLPEDGVYRPWDFRPSQAEQGPGAAGYEDWRVMQRQSGAGMAVDIGKSGVGEMVAWIRGSTRDAQGVYRVDNILRSAPTTSTFLSQITVDVPTAHATLPRIDIVVLRLLDVDHQGGSVNKARVHVIQGTATSGATLNNRNGAAAVPADAIHLADILVPGGSSSVVTGNIRDRRQFPRPGVVPPLLTAADIVAMMPPPANIDLRGLGHGNHDLYQSAALMHLPRRIVGATRIRWRYTQDATTPVTGNYVIGIYDPSGRKIVTTSATAFTGVGAAQIERAETITETTLEAGNYYVFFGVDSTNTGHLLTPGVLPAQARNMMLFATSGGTSAPDTLLSMTDAVINGNAMPVPVIALSVG